MMDWNYTILSIGLNSSNQNQENHLVVRLYVGRIVGTNHFC